MGDKWSYTADIKPANGLWPVPAVHGTPPPPLYPAALVYGGGNQPLHVQAVLTGQNYTDVCHTSSACIDRLQTIERTAPPKHQRTRRVSKNEYVCVEKRRACTVCSTTAQSTAHTQVPQPFVCPMYRREAANDRERVRMNLMTDAFIRCVYGLRCRSVDLISRFMNIPG
jgi:hypothetical protein